MITETFNKMRAALKVVTLDPNLRACLQERDPKALSQMVEAVELADRMAEEIRASEGVLVAIMKHHAEAQRIEASLQEILRGELNF